MKTKLKCTKRQNSGPRSRARGGVGAGHVVQVRGTARNQKKTEERVDKNTNGNYGTHEGVVKRPTAKEARLGNLSAGSGGERIGLLA